MEEQSLESQTRETGVIDIFGTLIRDVSNLKELGSSQDTITLGNRIVAHGKKELKRLKKMFIAIQASNYFKKQLASSTDTWHVLSDIDETSIRQEILQLKTEIEALKDGVIQLSSTISHQESVWRSKESELRRNAAKRAELKQRREELQKTKNLLDDVDHAFIFTEGKLQSTNDLISHMEDNMHCLQTEIAAALTKSQTLSEECAQLANDMTDMWKKLDDKENNMLANTEANHDWYSQAQQVMEQLGTVQEQSRTADSLHLTFHPPSDKESSGSEQKCLTLTVKFNNLKLEHPVMTGFVVDNPNLGIDDIIAQCVERNDLRALIVEVKNRWNQLSHFLNELANLQDRYAVDWVSERRHLRVMLKSDTSKVCTLCVPQDYPSLQHNITIRKPDGIKDHDMHYSNLKPSSQNPTLTDWVEYISNSL